MRPNKQLFQALSLSSLASVLLFIVGFVAYDEGWLWFLNWNLFLAWLPLVFAWILVRKLHVFRWSSWKGIVLTALWLGFLPNSFYLASDFIHLNQDTPGASLFSVTMLLSYTMSGLLLGYTSLYLLHKELLKRLSARWSHTIVAIILLACSFAIYLGRFLRWNTWDVLVNPFGILFDVSDRFINPAAHEQTFRITIVLFILLGSLYMVVFKLIRAIRKTKH